MIRINFDLETGIAKLAQTTTIKVGADVPVQIVFSAAPGDVDALQLTLGTDAAAPTVLAYTEDFDQENDTTWTALLDASDARLTAYMAGKTATVIQAELTCLLDGAHQVTPNMPVTVQPRILTGPTTSEGGPVYLTEALADARYAQVPAPSSFPRPVLIRAKGTEQLVPTATDTKVTFGLSEADESEMWISASNQAVMPRSGVALFTVTLAGDTTAWGLRLKRNGTEIHQLIEGVSFAIHTASLQIPVTVGDTWEVWVYHSAGGGMNVETGTRLGISFVD